MKVRASGPERGSAVVRKKRKIVMNKQQKVIGWVWLVWFVLGGYVFDDVLGILAPCYPFNCDSGREYNLVLTVIYWAGFFIGPITMHRLRTKEGN